MSAPSVSMRVASDVKTDTTRSGYPVKLDSVPVYASNTAAIAGGLTAGDVYRLPASEGSPSLMAIVY